MAIFFISSRGNISSIGHPQQELYFFDPDIWAKNIGTDKIRNFWKQHAWLRHVEGGLVYLICTRSCIERGSEYERDGSAEPKILSSYERMKTDGGFQFRMFWNDPEWHAGFTFRNSKDGSYMTFEKADVLDYQKPEALHFFKEEPDFDSWNEMVYAFENGTCNKYYICRGYRGDFTSDAYREMKVESEYKFYLLLDRTIDLEKEFKIDRNNDGWKGSRTFMPTRRWFRQR